MKYLVIAGTTWKAVHAEESRGPHAPHLVVMAMDSSFVHARVLYDFLMHNQGWSGVAVHERLVSELWDKYSGALHSKVLHAGKNRPFEPTNTDMDLLKDLVGEFVIDVLDLWQRATDDLEMSAYREVMKDVRREAILAGGGVAEWFGIAPEFD